jgi:uncharacterized membrane protein YqaE (UPF0057 family)
MTMKLDTDTLLHVIIALLLPPVAVFLKRGAGMELIISIVLTICFFIPGLIYALLIVLGKIK